MHFGLSVMVFRTIMPRFSGIKTSSLEEWFRVTIIIPFIDSFILKLKIRLNNSFKVIIPIENLIPDNKNAYNIEENDEV